MVRFLILAFTLMFCLSCASAPGVAPEVLAAEYYNLGNAYFQLKKYKEAGEYYQKALSYDRENAQALYNLARSLAEQGKWTEAGSQLEGLQGRDPQNLMVLKTMAYLKYLQGEKQASLELYAQALQAGAGDQETWRNAGLVAWDLGEKEKSAGYLESYRKSGGAEGPLLVILGEIYLDLGRETEGADLLAEQSAALGENPEAALKLAQTRVRQKAYDKALEAYALLKTADQKASKKRPEVWFEAGALVWTEVQDPNKAEEFFRLALDQGFNDSEAVKALFTREDLVRRNAMAALFKEKGLPKEDVTDGAP